MDIQVELKRQEIFLKQRFFALLSDEFTIKTKTLGGNTVRAFSKPKCYEIYTPTSIFKHWVHFRFFGNPRFRELVFEEHDFEKIHCETLQDLKGYWFDVEKSVSTTMSFYFFGKMTDLLFKSITKWDKLNETRREWFFENAHAPLDKYSLDLLNRSTSKMHFPNPSMNIVENEVHYREIQLEIRQLVSPFSPLLFDLLAWDYLRQRTLEAAEKFELVRIKERVKNNV